MYQFQLKTDQDLELNNLKVRGNNSWTTIVERLSEKDIEIEAAWVLRELQLLIDSRQRHSRIEYRMVQGDRVINKNCI